MTNKEYQREWRKRNPNYYNNRGGSRVANKTKLQSKYGLSLEAYEALEQVQIGKCKICNNPPTKGKSLAVDHDHKTKRIRGLLCNNCNLMLGHAKDSKETLLKAIEYLTE